MRRGRLASRPHRVGASGFFSEVLRVTVSDEAGFAGDEDRMREERIGTRSRWMRIETVSGTWRVVTPDGEPARMERGAASR